VEHLHHFRLSVDPFRNDARLRDYADTIASRDALLRLDRGLRQAKGLVVLAGAVGAGKTMVVRRLLESLEEEMFEASMLVVVNGAADAGGLLARYAGQLGVEEPAAARQALLGQLYEQLAIVREDGRHAVLIIDDADVLAGSGTLAEVCGLLKLEYEERRLLSLVLAGGPGLEARLAADPGLQYRVDVKVRLRGLDEQGTNEYLDHRLKLADGAPELFEPAARAAHHRCPCRSSAQSYTSPSAAHNAPGAAPRAG
jgi:type II secretory pathway predicted ATPase ExeA